MKQPKNDSRYEWTSHAWMKMQHYGISEGRIKRIIRFPARIEEGIADDTIAAMQPTDSKNYQELWVMYTLTNNKQPTVVKKKGALDNVAQFLGSSGKKIRVITAWRYPGKSPERDPIPQEILSEIKNLL